MMCHGGFTLISLRPKEVCIDGLLKTSREFIRRRSWLQMRLEGWKCICLKMLDIGYACCLDTVATIPFSFYYNHKCPYIKDMLIVISHAMYNNSAKWDVACHTV
jgi:hypothetical protein